MIEPGVVVADRYRIVRTLGEGGMGTVFEGEHTGVGRKVAVKVLHAEVAKTPAVLERFQLEARSAAAIGHDNIIDVLDFGIHDESPFMVMEFLRGVSLSERLNLVGHLSHGHAAYIMSQVLSALAAAHEAGIVHRDLKPDNVFLVQKAGFPDFVKLLDFGIAKLRTDDSGVDAKAKAMTQTGAVLGTPHYMAPEQALAKRDLDQRVDVYAAGAMLYEMLTGMVAFDAPSEAELLMEIAYRMRDLVSPSAIVPTVPKALDEIVFKAMAKDREQRYPDANAFAAALAPFVEAPPQNIADSTGKLKIQLKPAAIEGQPVAAPSPNASLAETGAFPAVTPDELPMQSTRGAWAIGLTVLLLAGAGTSIALFHGRSGNGAGGAHTNAAPVPRLPQPATPPPSTPIVDANARIDLENVPDDAIVTLDEHAEPSRHLTLERGTTHTLRVQAAGRQPFTTTFVADRDRSIVIAMLPETAPTPDHPVTAEATPHANVAPGPSRTTHAPSSGTASNAAAGIATHTNPPRDHARTITNPLPVSTEF
jgi:serine/threonine-protein kinase